jgi:hypothetical protein
MELTNEHKNAHSPEGKKSSVADKTDNATHLNNTPVKIIADDVELNEDQLDIISGGGGSNDAPIIVIKG